MNIVSRPECQLDFPNDADGSGDDEPAIIQLARPLANSVQGKEPVQESLTFTNKFPGRDRSGGFPVKISIQINVGTIFDESN